MKKLSLKNKSAILYFLFVFFLSFSPNVKAQKSDSLYTIYFIEDHLQLAKDSLLKFQKFVSQFSPCTTCKYKLFYYSDKSTDLNLIRKRKSYLKKLFKDTSLVSYGIIEDSIKNNEELIQYNTFQLVVYENETTFYFGGINFDGVYDPNSSDTLVNSKSKLLKEFERRNVAIHLDINFHEGSDKILRKSKKQVQILYDYLKSNSTVNAIIIGNVCCKPDMVLSKARAFAVYNYLVSRGIDKKRLSYSGASDKNPMVKETNEKTRKINRRVDIILN